MALLAHSRIAWTLSWALASGPNSQLLARAGKMRKAIAELLVGGNGGMFCNAMSSSMLGLYESFVSGFPPLLIHSSCTPKTDDEAPRAHSCFL